MFVLLDMFLSSLCCGDSHCLIFTEASNFWYGAVHAICRRLQKHDDDCPTHSVILCETQVCYAALYFYSLILLLCMSRPEHLLAICSKMLSCLLGVLVTWIQKLRFSFRLGRGMCMGIAFTKPVVIQHSIQNVALLKPQLF